MQTNPRLFWVVVALAVLCLFLGAKVLSKQYDSTTQPAVQTAISTAVGPSAAAKPTLAPVINAGVGTTAAGAHAAGSVTVIASPVPTSSAPTAVPIATIPPPPAPPTVAAYGALPTPQNGGRSMQGLHSNL